MIRSGAKPPLPETVSGQEIKLTFFTDLTPSFLTEGFVLKLLSAESPRELFDVCR
jgi:hypothetical protein